MNLDKILREEIAKAVQALFNQTIDNLQIQPTNHEFEGSHTLVCFPLTKLTRKSPEETAKLVGEYLVNNSIVFSWYNLIVLFFGTNGEKIWNLVCLILPEHSQ